MECGHTSDSRSVVPSPDELRATFEMLQASSYLDVPGVLRVDSASRHNGPIVGISACTHGNEPCGLAAIWYCLREGFLRNSLVKGSVIFMVNNLAATAEYFRAQSD